MDTRGSNANGYHYLIVLSVKLAAVLFCLLLLIAGRADAFPHGGSGNGITGTLTASLPKLRGSTSGTVTVTGTLTATVPVLTGSVPGMVGGDGTLSAALPRAQHSMPRLPWAESKNPAEVA